MTITLPLDPTSPVLFSLLVLLSLAQGIALLIGGRAERAAAAIATIATILWLLFFDMTWQKLEVYAFILDILVLIGFWMIALTSDRFWPYWITGLQLICVLAHVETMLFAHVHAVPYAIFTTMLAFPIGGIICAGAINQFRRAQAARRTERQHHA